MGWAEWGGPGGEWAGRGIAERAGSARGGQACVRRQCALAAGCPSPAVDREEQRQPALLTFAPQRSTPAARAPQT